MRPIERKWLKLYCFSNLAFLLNAKICQSLHSLGIVVGRDIE